MKKKIPLKPEKDPDGRSHIYFVLSKTNYYFVASFSTSLCSISQAVLPGPVAAWKAPFHLPHGDAALKSLQDVPGGSLCCPWNRYRVHVFLALSHCSVPEGGFSEVTEVCGYMGGPARLAGPQGATRSLSKQLKTFRALAYPEAQASLYSNQYLHCCLFALRFLNTGQNYRAVTARTVLKWSEESGHPF